MTIKEQKDVMIYYSESHDSAAITALSKRGKQWLAFILPHFPKHIFTFLTSRANGHAVEKLAQTDHYRLIVNNGP